MNTENNNNKSGKNAYLIILTIVTVVCILVGVFWHIGGWFGRNGTSSIFGWKWHWNWSDSDPGDMNHETISLDDFDTIDIDLAIGEVVIKEGSKFSLAMDFPEKYMPEYSVSNGNLKITHRKAMNVGFSNMRNDDYKVELEVPKGVDFDLVKVNCSLGDIRINGLSADKFDIDESLGEIKLDYITAKDIEVCNSMGSVNIRDAEAASLNGDLSMGDLRVESSKIDNVDCNNSMGSVSFEGQCEWLDIDNNMGDIRVDSKSDWKGTLECDMGSVKVNGENYGTKCKR